MSNDSRLQENNEMEEKKTSNFDNFWGIDNYSSSIDLSGKTGENEPFEEDEIDKEKQFSTTEKENIINKYEKSDFSDFLSFDKTGYVLNLFDDEGIDILTNSKRKEERIDYILCYSPFANDLFNNELFVDAFLNNNYNFYPLNLCNLNNQACFRIIRRCFELKKDELLARIFSTFNQEGKMYVLNNFFTKIDYRDILCEILNVEYDLYVIMKIVSDYQIKLDNENLNPFNFFYKLKEFYFKNQSKRNKNEKMDIDVVIPSNMITRDFAKYLFDRYPISQLRDIVDMMMFSTNTDLINNYIKKEELKVIKEMLDKSLKRDNEILLDYIIDYFFEDKSYNVNINIKELLSFYYRGNIEIEEEKIILYNDILNIEFLSTEEIKELFLKLQSKNILEEFYDDIRKARTISRKMIKEATLTMEELQRYENKSMTKKYGVPVYDLSNIYFYAIAKTEIGPGSFHENDILPTGHSFSLVGSSKLDTFRPNGNYLYDTSFLNPEQIVHIYPADSFTLYRPFEDDGYATNRVNVLQTPDELAKGIGCNEILILEEGTRKTEMDDKIKRLPKMAVYAVNQISEEDVMNAKREKIGIAFVDKIRTKEYFNLEDSYENIVSDTWKYKYR